MELVIGDKAYSTWSLRPWLVLKHCGAVFDEIVVPLNQPDTDQRIREHSPSGLVPVLKVEGEVIWDSMAIAVWAAERYPQARLWPSEAHARFGGVRDARRLHRLAHGLFDRPGSLDGRPQPRTGAGPSGPGQGFAPDRRTVAEPA
ncbi:glutathione S-transferase N-terminal domain-containing protein [Brevundimonas fontaquae]|uniref:glutathione S-transferase N-terminal domain-containing protein n=1 Tax=Brevundimonas fontaquae TaxID=2813778 RepID=UPI0033138EB8